MRVSTYVMSVRVCDFTGIYAARKCSTASLLGAIWRGQAQGEIFLSLIIVKTMLLAFTYIFWLKFPGGCK